MPARFYTLAQISALFRIPIHDLKEAIKDGRLNATLRGKYLVSYEEVIRFIPLVTRFSGVRVRYELDHMN